VLFCESPPPPGWPHHPTRSRNQAQPHRAGSRAGPLPFRLAETTDELLQPLPSSNGPPPQPRVQGLQAPSGGGRGSPCWLRPHRRLTLNSPRLRYRLPPSHLPHPLCSSIDRASPRPPIRRRLIFSFDLIVTYRSRRREGFLDRRSAGWWRRFVDLRAPGFLDLRRYVHLSRPDRISGSVDAYFLDLGPGRGY
jgi:hypothetical protein